MNGEVEMERIDQGVTAHQAFSETMRRKVLDGLREERYHADVS